MIGSCTNASFEDLGKAAVLFREAREAGLKPKMPVFITAGSEKIRATVEREGILEEFEAAGATILSNSCGPCVGQWNRKEVAKVCLTPWVQPNLDHLLTPFLGKAQLRDLLIQPQLRRQTRW
jgi:aconitase A